MDVTNAENQTFTCIRCALRGQPGNAAKTVAGGGNALPSAGSTSARTRAGGGNALPGAGGGNALPASGGADSAAAGPESLNTLWDQERGMAMQIIETQLQHVCRCVGSRACQCVHSHNSA